MGFETQPDDTSDADRISTEVLIGAVEDLDPTLPFEPGEEAGADDGGEIEPLPYG